jgi:hypothetical protein
MKVAIYARYSSENQRPESIEDQTGAARSWRSHVATAWTPHIFTGMKRSREHPGTDLASKLSLLPRVPTI